MIVCVISDPPPPLEKFVNVLLPFRCFLDLGAYFARLNPAISHNQCPCQDQSAGISAHELSTVLAFVQGLPERVGWSVDINVIHGVIQKWSVFDECQPSLSNLQPADHEMYALLAMFGTSYTPPPSLPLMDLEVDSPFRAF